MDVVSWADPEGGHEIWTPPLENHTTAGFLSNTGPGPLKIRKATKPAFNVGIMAFRWQADDGPLLVLLDPTKTKKNVVRVQNFGQNFLDPRMCSI